MSDSGQVKMLGELASLRTDKVTGRKDSDKPYIGLEHMASGDPFLLGVAQSGSSVSTNSLFHKGDVLFGKLRPNLRKSLPAPFDGYCSTDILVLQPVVGCDPGFVARVFQREDVFAEAVRTAEGTKMPRTSWSRLREYTVFSPQDDSGRQAIARILDVADEAIAKTEVLVAKLKSIKQGLLHGLLTRGLDDNGELRDPVKNPEQFRETQSGKIPKGWGEDCLDRIVSFRPGYGFPEKFQGQKEGELPFFKVSDMDALGNNPVLSQANHYVNIALAERNCWRPHPKGAVAFAKVGAALLLNRRRILGQPSLIDNNMMVSVAGPEVREIYLYWWLQTIDFACVAQTTALPSVNQTQLGKIPVGKPTLEEQDRIVAVMATHDKHIRAEENCLSKLKAIKKGLMQDLLSGRVRVQTGNVPSYTTG